MNSVEVRIFGKADEMHRQKWLREGSSAQVGQSSNVEFLDTLAQPDIKVDEIVNRAIDLQLDPVILAIAQ